MEDKKEGARLVETLALGSEGESTQKNYRSRWNVWVAERAAQGEQAWLQRNADNPNPVLSE